VKAIKSDSDSDGQKRSPGFEKKREEETRDDTAELATKKGRQVFSGKNRVTPSVAAPGVTHPSDATEDVTPSMMSPGQSAPSPPQ